MYRIVHPCIFDILSIHVLVTTIHKKLHTSTYILPTYIDNGILILLIVISISSIIARRHPQTWFRALFLHAAFVYARTMSATRVFYSHS